MIRATLRLSASTSPRTTLRRLERTLPPMFTSLRTPAYPKLFTLKGLEETLLNLGVLIDLATAGLLIGLLENAVEIESIAVATA